MFETHHVEIPSYGIKIELWQPDPTRFKECGVLTSSNLYNHIADPDDSGTEKDRVRLMVDALESLILAQACEGIDITTIGYKKALSTAINAIIDHCF